MKSQLRRVCELCGQGHWVLPQTTLKAPQKLFVCEEVQNAFSGRGVFIFNWQT